MRLRSRRIVARAFYYGPSIQESNAARDEIYVRRWTGWPDIDLPLPPRWSAPGVGWPLGMHITVLKERGPTGKKGP